MPLARPTHLVNAATHPTQASAPLSTARVEFKQGGAPSRISARKWQEHHHRCSWPKLTSRQQAAMDSPATRSHANTRQHQQGNGHRHRPPDDCEARGTGIHYGESPAWTDTQQPKREPAIKKQTASTW